MNTYLGKKGYTILKAELPIERQTAIKESLIVQPFNMMSAINKNAEVKTFPVYRESSSKLYVPHYYGVEQFGPPKKIKLSEGLDIALEFQGALRDYQAPVVQTFLDHCQEKGYGGGLLELPCAWGKTSASLNILSRLKKKTIVIVHKEFLLNQWVERIQQFLPQARIGRLQGPVVDIEDKDIVIGMLQSLSMKEYPEELFDSFGLTIIDEVHHISSEVFSNCLFKLVTKFMLGLSATMNRKDGTTHVFKMFLGPVIFKGTRDEKHAVEVRGIQYKVNDDEFNETRKDFRGNTMFSFMISKLCEYNHRSDFILRILKDMLEENPTQQVMILAHNRNLLTYLHDAIQHRQMGTVGYYVGGMKEKDLKETERRQVVIATFSMASEGLDIPTLSSLILATPKTDIEQSVGRILRMKHANPIVVDIIDPHDTFQKQWNKRKAFYKKQGYKIVGTSIHTYSTDRSSWKVLYDPDTVGSKRERRRVDSSESDSDGGGKEVSGVCLL